MYTNRDAPHVHLIDHSRHLNVKDFLNHKFICNGENWPKRTDEHPHLIFDKTWVEQKQEKGAAKVHVHLMDQTRTIGRVLWSAEYPLKQVVLRSDAAVGGGQ